jgi:hypothetical protein
MDDIEQALEIGFVLHRDSAKTGPPDMTLSFPRSQSWAFGPPEEDGNSARPAHCAQVSAGAGLGAPQAISNPAWFTTG